MKVLSLCDGLSGGKLAFAELGIELESYCAVEIEKYPRMLAEVNFEFEITRPTNDVTQITEEMVREYGPFDWVIFGAPCQSVSKAGNNTGLEGKSGLLYDCLRVLDWAKKYNPDLKYLIENVDMKKEFLLQFNELIGHEPVLINSALVTAQNRKRQYWCNFPVSQPEDKGLILLDILEDNPFSGDITYLSDSTAKRLDGYGVRFIDGNEDKAKCLTARDYEKNGKQGNYLKWDSLDNNLWVTPKNIKTATLKRITWDSSGKGHRSQQDIAKPVTGKSNCLSASRTEEKAKIFYPTAITYSKSTRYIDENGKKVQKKKDSVESYVEERVKEADKSNTLVTGEGCNGQSTGNFVKDAHNLKYRKLTVRECARLQGIPDTYDFSSVSKTRAYQAIGNGWSIPVISHIIKCGLDWEEESLL